MTVQLLCAAVAGLGALLVSILWLRLHAFVALLIASMVVGLGSGMSVETLLASIQTGMGSTLGFVAIVVGLGAMMGKMLEVSGGAEALARRLLVWCGQERSVWALALSGFIISIPVFFDVGLVILAPLVYGLAKQTGRPVTRFALPLLAGLATTHAFIPPTPGPTLVSHELGADLGQVALLGIAVGLPSAAIAGIWYGRWVSKYVAGSPALSGWPASDGREPASVTGAGTNGEPSLFAVLSILLLPLLLLALGSFLPELLTPKSGLHQTVLFLGHPFVALLLATLLAFSVLGTRCGLSRQQVSDVAASALEPAGTVLLVTGAGGVLKQVLVDSKAGVVVAQALEQSQLPLLLLCFLFAAIIRVLQGSATVAMVAAAGFLAPMLAAWPLDSTTRALCVVCIAAGATFLSHINDSGFWLVSRYFGMNMSETLRTWSVATAILGLSGLAFSLLLHGLL